jgi:hypothetical protein
VDSFAGCLVGSGLKTLSLECWSKKIAKGDCITQFFFVVNLPEIPQHQEGSFLFLLVLTVFRD